MERKNKVYGLALFFCFFFISILAYKESLLADVNNMQFVDQALMHNAVSFDANETVSGSFTGHSPDENVVYYKFTTDSSDSFYEIIYGGQVSKDDFLEFEWGSEYDLISNAGYVDSTGETRHKYVGKGLEPNHTYYFKFWSWEPASYTLKIQKYEDDIADIPAGAKKVMLGQSFGGKINIYDDQDCFSFTTDRTESFYQFDFDDSVEFSIYADKLCEERVFESLGKSSGVIAEKWIFEPGHTYYLIAGGEEGNYSIKISQLKDDAGDDSTKARKLDMNTKENIKLCLQQEWDEDWFVFKTGQKKKYILSIVSKTEPETNMDVLIYSGNDKASRDLLLDADHRHLVDNVIMEEGRLLNGTYEPEVTLKPNHTYYIGVFGVGGIDGRAVCWGDYELGIREAGPEKLKLTQTGAKKVKVTWKKMNDADGYEIYRSDGYPFVNFKKIKTIKSGKTEKYTDTIKQKKRDVYCYKIRAYRQVDGKKIYTAFTNLENLQEIWM